MYRYRHLKLKGAGILDIRYKFHAKTFLGSFVLTSFVEVHVLFILFIYLYCCTIWFPYVVEQQHDKYH
jgi:hypothetical protein